MSGKLLDGLLESRTVLGVNTLEGLLDQFIDGHAVPPVIGVHGYLLRDVLAAQHRGRVAHRAAGKGLVRPNPAR